MSQSKPENKADTTHSIDKNDPHPEIPTTYRSRTGVRMMTFAMTLALTLGGGFFLVKSLKARNKAALAASTDLQSQEAPTVEIITVTHAPPSEALRLPAEARGWYGSAIYARVSGYLTNWLVDIGDRVKKNQVLAIIDTPELDAQLEAAKAQLKASEAEVKVKEADAEFAKSTYERWQGSAKGVVSDQEREDKKAGHATAEAKLNAARARVNLDKSNIDRLTFLAQFKQVTAPYDGVITERRVDVGDLVTAGSTSNTSPLFEISQYDQIRVFANVPQRASGETSVGTAAAITASEFPSEVFEGKITRTSQSIDPQARTLRVEIDLPNASQKLLPGMYLKVAFKLRPRTSVQIPASALVFKTGGPQVAVIRSNNTVKFIDVQIGRDNGNTVDIAAGLSGGERVALNINNQIRDGSGVTVKDNDKVASK